MSHADKERFSAERGAHHANKIARVARLPRANRYSMFRISSPRRGRDDKPPEADPDGANQH